MLGQTNVLLVKQPLAAIKIAEPVIHRCKKVGKIHQNQI